MKIGIFDSIEGNLLVSDSVLVAIASLFLNNFSLNHNIERLSYVLYSLNQEDTNLDMANREIRKDGEKIFRVPERRNEKKS